MEIKVLEYSDVSNYYELSDWITDTYEQGAEGSDIIDLTFNMFEGDPEILSIYGGRISFIDVDVQGVKYVIYIDSEYTIEAPEISRILTAFFKEDYKETFFTSDTHQTDRFIDYRNGQGYHYTRWYFTK